MTRTEKLEAVKHFAPPLIVHEQVDRRGARLRSVSPKAVAYVKRAGFEIADVYPEDLAVLRDIAPKAGTADAALFGEVTGLKQSDFAGEAPKARGWCWKCIAIGFAIGACMAGPAGAAAGAMLGAAR